MKIVIHDYPIPDIADKHAETHMDSLMCTEYRCTIKWKFDQNGTG
jgi:hypothetical protein